MADRTVDVRDPADAAQPERSIGELLGDLAREFTELTRKEVQLARTEIQQEAVKASRVAGMFGGAALGAYLALLLLSFAAAWGLGEVMPVGWGFVIVAVVHAAVAAVLFTLARSRMRAIEPVPRETVETLKEDAQWAKAQAS